MIGPKGGNLIVTVPVGPASPRVRYRPFNSHQDRKSMERLVEESTLDLAERWPQGNVIVFTESGNHASPDIYPKLLPGLCKT